MVEGLGLRLVQGLGLRLGFKCLGFWDEGLRVFGFRVDGLSLSLKTSRILVWGVGIQDGGLGSDGLMA